MYNVYGVYCDTYEEACAVAGIETPAQMMALDYQEDLEADIFGGLRQPPAVTMGFKNYNCIGPRFGDVDEDFDDIPF